MQNLKSKIQNPETDVCILGGGPGGYVCAIRCAQLGMRVALVEKEQLGGVCLNKGCIPTKAMLHTAEVLSLVRRAHEFGVRVEGASLDYLGAVAYRDKVVRELRTGVTSLLRSQGVEVITGRGSFKGDNIVEVEAPDGRESLSVGSIVLATGSRPAVPSIPGADVPGVIDSDAALGLPEVPSSIVVIGGGAVGAEWADLLNAYGCEVTLVEMLPSLVPTEDPEIGAALARSFTRRGIKVLTGATVRAIESDGENGKAVLAVDSQGIEHRLTGEVVLMAVGRRANVEDMGLQEAGVRLEGGWVWTDQRLRTSVPSVYAIGDVTGHQLFAHLASAQGLVAAANMAGGSKVVDYDSVPGCIFTHPEIASVGLREDQARERGFEVMVGKFPFAASGRARTLAETEGLVKIVAQAPHGRVLGVHVFGAGASQLIGEAALALRLEATLEDLADTIHPHPTLEEATMEAAMAAMGMAIHLPKPRARNP